MQGVTLEDILACPTLPSLPAVALRVIELTSDDNVSMDELAATIQADQALAAKVLRTVNSSFYGLRERCASIRKALVLLGLSPVKSLTLGFSLVNSIDMEKSPRFDYVGYWRRGLFTAVGARVIAETARLEKGDEAFLAGLLQDIGMIALHEAIGDLYVDVLETTGGDHARVLKAELSAFDLQHPEIGAMLAERWRLPAELVIPIRYHEKPQACPNESSEIVRAVGLGNIACDVMTDEDPTPATRRFYQRAEQWFRLTTDDCNEALKRINAGAKEFADLFSLDAGPFGDPESIVATAEAQLIQLSRSEPRASYAAEKLEEIIADAPETDPITGIPSRLGFEQTLAKLHQKSLEVSEPLSLLQVAIEGLGGVSSRAGHIAADEIVLSTVGLLHRRFEPVGGVVCRLGGSVFAALLPGIGSVEAKHLAEAVRNDLCRLTPQWMSGLGLSDVPIIASHGLTTLDAETKSVFDEPGKLVVASARSVKAARAAGGNCLRVFRPRPSGGGAPGDSAKAA